MFSINHSSVIVGVYLIHCILVSCVGIGLEEVVHTFVIDTFIISPGIKHLVVASKVF
jgi:hypothetical protein